MDLHHSWHTSIRISRTFSNSLHPKFHQYQYKMNEHVTEGIDKSSSITFLNEPCALHPLTLESHVNSPISTTKTHVFVCALFFCFVFG